MDISLALLPELLLPWYRENKRDLPWRLDRNPYHIWLSEIMLQQTRVEAVKGYYGRFLAALPDIKALSVCDDDSLHKLWEGLGYYSRVRNLKKAAGVIMEAYGGVFPRTYEQVLSLPGIGEYTAGAICSIAYDLPVPAVDGNVLRVISRIRCDSRPIDDPKVKADVRNALLEIYPKSAGDFTQALMELGATICGPNRAPDCEKCPCKTICQGCAQNMAQSLPVKTPKKKRRHEDMTVFILSCGDRYAIEKRGSEGLLASLWQFPNLPGHLTVESALEAVKEFDLSPREIKKVLLRKHIFTHIQWDMQGIFLETGNQNSKFTWLTAEEINAQAALPTAFRQFWEER